MLTTGLLARASGDLPPSTFARDYTSRLVYAIQPAPRVSFDGGAGYASRKKPRGPLPGRSNNRVVDVFGEAVDEVGEDGDKEEMPTLAHRAGVNAIAVEQFEGRYMVSGGADCAVSMWDLEAARDATRDGRGSVTHKPLGSVPKSDKSHTFGVTGLSWYPFDTGAFLSSSYDHSLKIYSSETLVPSASFALDSVIYTHSISPISTSLLVACATQHPAVRLVDLRSGSSTHSLSGHVGGAVLSVAWSPKHEQVLCSGGSDGTVRFWDVRRAAPQLGVLDMDDYTGIDGHDGLGTLTRRRERGHAHTGPVNGIAWTEDGRYVVTAGHDQRIRVWNTATAANTLANFGPVIRNSNVASVVPLLAPKSICEREKDVMFFPNDKEILMYELFDGKLIKRMRAPPVQQQPSIPREGVGQRNVIDRVTALAWRSHSIEMLSAHTDGTIRSWQPRTSIDALVDDAEREEDGMDGEGEMTESRKRKRQVLEDVYNDLTKPKITFT